jgi:hypothetical protein
MKKLAIGCLIVLVVGGAAAGGLAYWGYLKVRSTVSQFAELAKVPDIERGVRVQTTFTPPESGELTAKQVDQLLKIQKRVKDRLGNSFATMERTYKSLTDKKEATVTDMPALVSAYRDLAAAWLDAKRTQVDALNDAHMSMSEYRWVRAQAYRSLGIPFVDVDFSRMAAEIRSSGKMTAEMPPVGLPAASAPPATVKLLEPHRDQLADYIPLVAFGL